MTVPAARTVAVDAAGTVYLQWPTAEIYDSLDYCLDASAAITNDHITFVAVSASPSGTGELVPSSVSVIGMLIKMTLSGGVAGRTYQVRIDATTQTGAEYSWIVVLPINAENATYPLPIAPDPFFGISSTWTYGGAPRPINPIVIPTISISEIVGQSRSIILSPSGNDYLQWPIAEPDDDLDYYLNIGAPLAQYNDSISLISVSVSPSGSGELQPTYLNTSDSIQQTIELWLAGGVPGRIYTVRVDVVTVENRTFSWLVNLPIDIQYAIPPIPLAPNPGFGPPLVWINSPIELESGIGFWELENGTGAWFWG